MSLVAADLDDGVDGARVAAALLGGLGELDEGGRRVVARLLDLVQEHRVAVLVQGLKRRKRC